VPGDADERRTARSHAVQRFQPNAIGRDEVGEIQLHRTAPTACGEQLGHLRFTETACQPNDSAIALLNDANPAVHIDR
jgi:hypothetical protein